MERSSFSQKTSGKNGFLLFNSTFFAKMEQNLLSPMLIMTTMLQESISVQDAICLFIVQRQNTILEQDGRVFGRPSALKMSLMKTISIYLLNGSRLSAAAAEDILAMSSKTALFPQGCGIA